MAVRPRMKWIGLMVLVLSTGSLVLHLWMTWPSATRFVVDYSSFYLPSTPRVHPPSLPSIPRDKDGRYVGSWKDKKLWRPLKQLEPLMHHSAPRTAFPVPGRKNNGYIYAKIFGGFEKIRPAICDLVTISRLLNATLVIPEIQESLRSKGVSYKYKSFAYLYDEEQFINELKKDVSIIRSLPENLKAARKRKKFPTFKPKRSASPSFYLKDLLPRLQKDKVLGLIIADGGCLQSILPASMHEYQRLRCRVAFHALRFRSEIQLLGQQMIARLRAMNRPFLSYHPGLVRETLAYHGCGELFQDVHTELIQYRRAKLIKLGIINDELSVDSYLRKGNGLCPLMPEEVGLLFRAMGYPLNTLIYIAGSETFGGQRVLIPLRAMFPNLVDRTVLCSRQELADLVGPETPLPSDSFQMPPVKTEQQLKDEWNRFGPRPRPLPPPPDRPIYRHEKEGWYGWITEKDDEPDPAPNDLRSQAHRLLLDALDYMVSVEADAFFPGFNNDGSGWPDFSSLVMGQRLYEKADLRTFRPDRKVVAGFFNITRDNLYHPKRNWTLSVREHLNRSFVEEGLLRQARHAKPETFISHPLPECLCRIPDAEVPTVVASDDGRVLYGGEEECPSSIQLLSSLASKEENGTNDDDAESDYENDLAELPESDGGEGESDIPLPIDQDDEWDPND